MAQTELNAKVPPLVVDLDGTLIHTDMLHESALKLLRDRPFQTIRIPFWLLKGKAFLKQKLAQDVTFDASHLPYNEDLLSWLRLQKAEGRELVLCTASDETLAASVAEHLQIFDVVMASDGFTNLAGIRKAEALEQKFGARGFDYAGNSEADLEVWRVSRRAVVVNASNALAQKAQALGEVERVFPSVARGLGVWRRVFRLHHWLKNILLFIPLVAAHHLLVVDEWIALLWAFVSFSLCASAVYIANDLFDLESDRQHPRKRHRPFASGAVPAWWGVLLVPLLLLGSLALGSCVGQAFLKSLGVYFVLTCMYSWGLKRVILIDCMALAILYTLRIVAGAAAVTLGLSFWLLAFSIFLFLSLAFVKRYAELGAQLSSGKQKVHGRGYYTSDAPLIQTMGIASGFSAVLVLALYLNSDAVAVLYQTPEFVWGAVPVMLCWIGWMWMQAHRGRMHDDPVVFAIKDKASLMMGLALATVLAIGTLGWPW